MHPNATRLAANRSKMLFINLSLFIKSGVVEEGFAQILTKSADLYAFV